MPDPIKNIYPLPSFCFKVEFDKVTGMDKAASVFFRSVAGLRSESEVLPVKEGGVNHTQWQLYNGTKYSNLVLKRGFSGSNEFLRWRDGWVTGRSRERANVTIQQLDSSMHSTASWTFKRAWPVKWELSEFDASKSEISIETLELAHDGILVISPSLE